MTLAQINQIFIARRCASAVYIVLWLRVRPSVCLVKGRGTARRQVIQRDPRRDMIGPSMWPIATDTQQWRGRSIRTRPIATDAQ